MKKGNLRLVLMAVALCAGFFGTKRDGLGKKAEPTEAIIEQAAVDETVPIVSEKDVSFEDEAGTFDYSDVPPFDGIHAWYDVNDDVPFFTNEDMAFSGQEYWELDALGRCTGAMALVGPETLPTEARGDISDVRPTGWKQARYEGIDPENGNYLYNRCHLIGHQLTGQDANERNLITGTRYMNVEGMLPFEDSVRMYVEGTGNHVVYRVRPIFIGDELLCRGVLMEARSVEDELVQFCAFCYNVQPGIVLDYSTGESSGPEYVEPAGDRSIAETADEEEAAGDDEEEKKVTYVLNTKSKKIHKPACSSVGDIKDKNKMETTKSRDELVSEGYSPCKRCDP